METLRLVPADCVFVDDLAVNVTAAEDLGMIGILVTNAADGALALAAALDLER